MTTFRDLVVQLSEVEGNIKYFQAMKKDLEQKLREAVDAGASHLRAMTGQDMGTVSFLHEGYKVKHNVAKKVSWDANVLNEICSANPILAQAMGAITTFEPKINEREFLKLPADIQHMAMPARSVTPQPAKIEVVLEESEPEPDF